MVQTLRAYKRMNDDKELKVKSVVYGSQWSQTGQLDFCNWQARRDNVISITLRQV